MFSIYVLTQNYPLPGLPDLEAFFRARASSEIVKSGCKKLKKLEQKNEQ
ncbi:hypothetical protein [Sigmofec virus UA08Rod_7256]|uniref:Uncharacterized protein n=1 Tax=Sigmofec virus UA08Rod_7256 TaxID=2929244 RepID=A0A976N0K1_9VIRU|nr:hypothetical protein [Sigmofec virus UA08Rod_7256]